MWNTCTNNSYLFACSRSIYFNIFSALFTSFSHLKHAIGNTYFQFHWEIREKKGILKALLPRQEMLQISRYSQDILDLPIFFFILCCLPFFSSFFKNIIRNFVENCKFLANCYKIFLDNLRISFTNGLRQKKKECFFSLFISHLILLKHFSFFPPFLLNI